MPVRQVHKCKWRAALNWTVRDLAEVAGLHRITIANWRSAAMRAIPKTYASLSRCLLKVTLNSSTRTEVAGGSAYAGGRTKHSAKVVPADKSRFLDWVSRTTRISSASLARLEVFALNGGPAGPSAR